MASVDGLISGINTTDMISKLMQLEALPQTALKNKVTAQNKEVAAYQSINSRVSSVLTAVRAMSDSATWGAMKATASSDAVTVTASAGAAAGSLSFTVDRLAASHTVTFTGKTVSSLTDATAAPVLTGNTLDVLLTDGTTTTITPTDKSLQSVVKKINETTNAAYTAAAVQVSPGQYTLQLTAKSSGDDNKFVAATKPLVNGDPQKVYVPTGLDLGDGKVTTVGADATLTVGSDPATQFQITSNTNTFTDLLPGLSISVSKPQTATPVTVSVSPDNDKIAAKAQALVDNANTLLDELASQTKTAKGSVAAGTLAGDSAMRALTQQVLGAVSSGADDLGSLSAVGISLTRDGRLSFDKTKFTDALAADPAKTRSYFDSYTDVAHAKAKTGTFEPGWDVAKGLARKLEAIGALASEGVILPTDPAGKAKEGSIAGLIKRKNEFIKDLNDQVAEWDIRLDARKASLQKQWAGLEVALGKLQSQSSWLSGQIASLPTSSS